MRNSPRSVHSRPAIAAAILLVLLALLASLGCDDDRQITFPVAPSGTIVGTISDGAPFADFRDATVRVEGASGEYPRFTAQTRPDSLGRYAITVPNGKVVVSVEGPYFRSVYYSSTATTYNSSDAEVIDVKGEVQRADFVLGRVSVGLEVAEELAEDDFYIGLASVNTNSTFGARHYFAANEIQATMRMLAPGQYRIWLQWQHNYNTVFLPVTSDSAAVLTVAVGQETRYESWLPQPSRISGSITGSWQTLNTGRPRVRIMKNRQEVAQVDVDADGSFELPLLVYDSIRILTTIDNMPGYIGGADYESATVFHLHPGGHIDGIERVESGLEVDIRGLDVSEYQYRFRIYDAGGHDLTRSVGDNGLYSGSRLLRLSNLLPGTAYLKVEPPSYSRSRWFPQFYSGREYLAEADPIGIPAAGGVASVQMTLLEGGRIRGRFLDQQGLAPPYGSISLELYRPGDPDTPVVTRNSGTITYDGETGDYEVCALLNGEYKLRAHQYNGLWRYWPGVESFYEAGVITIADHGEVTGIDMTVP